MLNNSQFLLNKLISQLEIETSLQHLSKYHEKWSTSIQGYGQASFHLVLEQDCHFHLLDQQDFVHLYRGDAIFLLRDIPFVITDVSQRTPPALNQLKRNLAPEHDLKAQSCSTHLACGFFKFKSKLSELFINALPNYLVLRENDQTLKDCLHVFELIRNEVRLNEQASTILIERLASILFFYLLRQILNSTQHDHIQLWKLFNDPVLYPLIVEIMTHPEIDWSLEYMAKHCQISRATFSKYFTDVAGFSATKFVLYYRIQVAQKLLAEGCSIQNCAEQVGYQSVAAFTRAFQRVSNQNPSHYSKA